MDFELPEELRLLKETVRNFVDRELIPIEMTSMDGAIMRPEVRAPLEQMFAQIRRSSTLSRWDGPMASTQYNRMPAATRFTTTTPPA